MKRPSNGLDLFPVAGILRTLGMFALAALFCSAAFAETVVYCAADGTLYIHVVGSGTVTVKNNGCANGPWVVRAMPVTNGVSFTSWPLDRRSKALAALNALPATGLSTISAHSAEYAAVTKTLSSLSSTDTQAHPLVVPPSQLPPHVFALLAVASSAPPGDVPQAQDKPLNDRSNIKNNIVPSPGEDPSGPLVVTGVTCNGNSVSVGTNYPVPQGATLLFTNTSTRKASGFLLSEAIRDANGQFRFPIDVSGGSFRLDIQNALGSFILPQPYAFECSAPASLAGPVHEQSRAVSTKGISASISEPGPSTRPGGTAQSALCAPGQRSAFQSATGQSGWELLSGPSVTSPRAPAVVSPYNGWGSIPGASWVSVDANRGDFLGPDHLGVAGDFTYQFVFCVCQPQGASLALSFLADNGATVKLNGIVIYSTTGDYNFQAPPKVVNYGGLHTGTNTLTIVVHNSASVTGLAALFESDWRRGWRVFRPGPSNGSSNI
jgi:hypothetical protein